jgi:hypothetical protein
VSDAELHILGHQYESGSDKNTEHYRYRVFREYLAAHRPLSPEMADAIFELGREDPDTIMGMAMMHEIIKLPECPPGVQEKVLASGDKSLGALVRRTRLLAELDFGLSEDLFERCLASQDAEIERRLLERAELTRNQLEQLAEAGTNRAVRNTAGARLRSKRYNV